MYGRKSVSRTTKEDMDAGDKRQALADDLNVLLAQGYVSVKADRRWRRQVDRLAKQTKLSFGQVLDDLLEDVNFTS